MNPFIVYLIKVNIAVALFYLIYRFALTKDTFLQLRRAFLLLAIFVPLVYPLISISGWFESNQLVNTLVHQIQLPEIMVVAGKQQPYFGVQEMVIAAYLTGTALLFIRFLFRIFSILRWNFLTKEETVLGIRVRVTDKAITPFSFFNRIYLSASAHTEDELVQILTHELAHVRQLHSVDVILSELMAMFCWINPAAWLLQREARQNLEFLADQKVIRSGHDSRLYQYHLLQLSYQQPLNQLTNNFIISPLKKRINMMNKQKSHNAGKLKYLLVAPLTLLLVAGSNAQTIMKAANVSIQVQPTLPDTRAENAQASDATGAVEIQPSEIVNETQPATNDPVFDVVEVMPQFPGGEKALMKFLGDNIHYPDDALKANIQGRVILQFIISSKGKVTDPKVIAVMEHKSKVHIDLNDSRYESLKKEALRMALSMPAWNPGKQGGKAVAVKYTLPISFAIQGDDKPASSTSNLNSTPMKDRPLVVLDGKPMDENYDLNAIDPKNIESISILKDKSATDIYGEKGKNGVVVITSKKQ